MKAITLESKTFAVKEIRGAFVFYTNEKKQVKCIESSKVDVIEVEETENGLRIYPAECIKPCKIKTYDDHRVAMSFTLPGLKAEGVEIIDPYCCRKTFENFYEVLEESVY